MTQSPEVVCHPSGIHPSTFQGKSLEVIWYELAVLVQGWTQHLRFRSCRSFAAKCSARGVKVLSSWGFTECVGGLCLCQAFLSVIFIFLSAIAVQSWINVLWHEKGISWNSVCSWLICCIISVNVKAGFVVLCNLCVSKFLAGTKISEIRNVLLFQNM